VLCVRHEAHCYIARLAGMDWRRCLWIWWLTRDPKGEMGKIACQETGSRAQAYGVVCREIRAIRRKPDCLKPSLQKARIRAYRKDA
jgi:hypothetical protein